MACSDKTIREKTDMRPSAQWSYSEHHKRDSTRDEAVGDVYDMLQQILELIWARQIAPYAHLTGKT